jgi:hypothetical protein
VHGREEVWDRAYGFLVIIFEGRKPVENLVVNWRINIKSNSENYDA